VVFDFSRGLGSVPSHPFLLKGPARSLFNRIPGLRVLKFQETQSKSGATQSVFALSFHPVWMSVGGAGGGDALLSPLLDPLEGPTMWTCGKLGLEGRSQFPALERGRGAC